MRGSDFKLRTYYRTCLVLHSPANLRWRFFGLRRPFNATSRRCYTYLSCVAQRRIERLRRLGKDPVLIGLWQAGNRGARPPEQILERTLGGRVVGPPGDPRGAKLADQLGKECFRGRLAVAAFG